jgi:hypothetical protein
MINILLIIRECSGPIIIKFLLEYSLKLFFQKNLKLLASLVVIIAPIIALLSDIGGAVDLLKSFTEKFEPLTAIQARLTPAFRHPQLTTNQEEAALSIEIRNYGKEPITLISATLSIANSKKLAIGKGSTQGGCALGPDQNENDPITLNPGQTKWITVGTLIDLKGISLYLTEEKQSEIFVHFLDGRPYSIAQSKYVADLNEFFSREYGNEATISVTLNSSPKENHIFIFPIAKGKDLFSKDGNLHHDWLIANWKEWRKSYPLGGYICK